MGVAFAGAFVLFEFLVDAGVFAVELAKLLDLLGDLGHRGRGWLDLESRSAQQFGVQEAQLVAVGAFRLVGDSFFNVLQFAVDGEFFEGIAELGAGAFEFAGFGVETKGRLAALNFLAEVFPVGRWGRDFDFELLLEDVAELLAELAEAVEVDVGVGLDGFAVL